MEERATASGEQPRSVAVGGVLGPYRIERQIGRGGMSTVYEAKHLSLDRTVALKVLLPSLAGDQAFVDRFLAEARAAARLDYPHIVPVYDCGEVGGVNYIAMKLLEGRDLKRVLEARREAGHLGLPLGRVISIASQAAGALEYAHQHRVVHRDVKPANIYVDENDRVTLVDFGIARALDYSSSTMTGMVMGTPAYMSPEQAQGKPADQRSDIYSLGVVTYEMIAGKPPFTGEPQAVMYAHVYTPAPSLLEARPDIPQGVAEAVHRALAKNPDDRFQTAGALALALTHAAGGHLAQQALEANAGADGDQTLTLGSTGPATGPISGPHTWMPGGITHGTMARVEEEEAAAAGAESAVAPSVARRRLSLSLLLAAGGALAGAVLLAWLLLLSPLAIAGDGRLAVTSDPPGATVTVDGNVLGTTPLAAQSLPSGPHEIVLDKPTYAEWKRSERIRPRQTLRVRAALNSPGAADLLLVKQAVVGLNARQEGGAFVYDAPVDSVTYGQPFGLIVNLVQKQPGVRDVSFTWEAGIYEPDGTRLTGQGPFKVTIGKDETEGHSFLLTGNFIRGGVQPGKYQLEFFVDNDRVVSKAITLTP